MTIVRWWRQGAHMQEKGDIDMADSGEYSDSKRPIEDDDEIVESDIDLDNTDVVEPDNHPPQKVMERVHWVQPLPFSWYKGFKHWLSTHVLWLQMGDPAVEVTEEKRDAAQTEKSKAMDAISEGMPLAFGISFSDWDFSHSVCCQVCLFSR